MSKSVSVSLIIPLAAGEAASREAVLGHQRRLLAEPGVSDVQVVVAGGTQIDQGSVDGAEGWLFLSSSGGAAFANRIAALRAAIAAASGEILLVLDPRRSYPTEAAAKMVEVLSQEDRDLVIGVPVPQGERSTARRLARTLLGLIGRTTLGTADIFSGLLAIRRSSLNGVPSMHQARGSRLVLDLLAWPCDTHRDVPVATAPGDRIGVFPLRIDDVRQLKRVLDQRFGTFSRLIQFCMVGASGMVIDLTLYALLQLFMSLPPARSLAILTALVWNFSLNRRLTFNDARGGMILRQFATYALGNALGIAVNFSLSLYLPQQFAFFDQHKLAAAVVGIIVATGISFSMSRWVVFIRHVPTTRTSDDQPRSLESQPALHESAIAS